MTLQIRLHHELTIAMFVEEVDSTRRRVIFSSEISIEVWNILIEGRESGRTRPCIS